ncbi:MAG: DUF5916 domain-containing protein [Bryobacterales bacterium]|nr:DUF5916 domain-containing protein [Bryobacterales bacterium]
MTDRRVSILRALTFALPALALATALAAAAPRVTLGRTQEPLRLDGRLDEAAWRTAPVVRLTQQSPQPGAPTPYETEVRLLRAGELLYFGFLCRDPEPAKISVRTWRRDGQMRGDDAVGVVLDTYGDRRTGYFFFVNAAGARADGLISDPEHPSLDWDGIWDARTRRTAEGWTAEILVPARTLNFTPGLEAWGANFQRYVPRERVTLRWTGVTLDAFFYDLSRAGALAGVGDLRQGYGLEASPYSLGRTTAQFGPGSRAWQGATGGDVTWKITPQLVTVFTANTDFAETEVDTRQINLTRFPLFFPEKRAFFLEGLNQFEFGLGLGRHFIPFFTRRVGLLKGRPIPIEAGAKLNGRIGRWNLAALEVRTRATELVPALNLGALRASCDLTSQFRVGTLVTHGDPEGLRENALVGFDAVWRTSRFRGDKNLLIGGWTAFTRGDRRPGQHGGRTGWGFKLDYPNDLVDCSTTLYQVGPALDPALGFLPRPGVRHSIYGCRLQPRPARDGSLAWIRQYFLRGYYERVVNHLGQLESWRYQWSPLGMQLESGDEFKLEWAPQYEFLPAPFAIAPGVVIPPGPYRFDRVELDAETSAHRPLQFATENSLGSFYSGRLVQLAGQLRWTSPEGRAQIGVGAEHNRARLREGRFVQRLWRLEGTLAWNAYVVLTTFLQYDSESRNLGVNTRLRWTFQPGNDLFVVWNRGWQQLVRSPGELALAPESEMLALKLRWTFRP